MEKEFTESTIYTNASLKSLNLQYVAFIVIFVLAPLSYLYWYYEVLKDSNFKFDVVIIVLTIGIFFLFIFLFSLFVGFRKFWVNRIITDVEGLTYYGFFKKNHSSWIAISSLEIYSSFLGKKMARIITKDGTFIFPYTMKEQSRDYPKLVLTNLDDWKWMDEHGNEEIASIENCPLYIDIQNHLRNVPK